MKTITNEERAKRVFHEEAPADAQGSGGFYDYT